MRGPSPRSYVPSIGIQHCVRFKSSNIFERSTTRSRISGNFVYLPAQQQGELVTNSATGQSVLYGKREQLSFGVTAKLTRYWSLAGTETINLINSTTLVNGVATPAASRVPRITL